MCVSQRGVVRDEDCRAYAEDVVLGIGVVARFDLSLFGNVEDDPGETIRVRVPKRRQPFYGIVDARKPRRPRATRCSRRVRRSKGSANVTPGS